MFIVEKELRIFRYRVKKEANMWLKLLHLDNLKYKIQLSRYMLFYKYVYMIYTCTYGICIMDHMRRCQSVCEQQGIFTLAAARLRDKCGVSLR